MKPSGFIIGVVVLFVIFFFIGGLFGYEQSQPDRIDIIIENQERIEAKLDYNRQMLDRIFYLLTDKESFCIERN